MSRTEPERQSPKLRALQETLARASDERVTQVVAAIDGLPRRGVADAIIAPLRPRLALLRPGRPLHWSRLLFLPLDPLIVPTARWRPGEPTIPRGALPHLSSGVRIGMGDATETIVRGIANGTTADAGICAEFGGLLWPMAARVLSLATAPDGWAGSGFPADAFAPLAHDVAVALEQVLAIDTVRAETELGVPLQFSALQPILSSATDRGPTALAMVVTLLLTRLPQAGPLLDCSTLEQAPLREAIVCARAVLLARIEEPGGVEALVVGSALANTAAAVRQIDALLCGLRNSGGTEVKEREASIRRRLDAGCRARFAAGLADDFIARLHAAASEPASATLPIIEATARNLRALEGEARTIGSAELYDTLLREAAAAVKTLPSGGALSLVDKVRLVEILLGPDEALAVLEAAA
jgi:hypothetical protein